MAIAKKRTQKAYLGLLLWSLSCHALSAVFFPDATELANFSKQEKDSHRQAVASALTSVQRGTTPNAEYVQIDDMRFPVNDITVKSGFTSTKWSGGTVYYEFDPGVTSAHQQAWLDAAAEWSAVAGVTFVARTNQPNYIYVKNDPGNWSYVGMIGGKQEMGIYNWSYKFIIAHEIGHALGLLHEQSRSDRDSYVNILTENITSGKEHNFDKASTTNYGDYDFDSVMHYGRTAFTKNGQNTIEPLPAYSSWLYLIGQRNHLSANDQSGMASRYPPTGVQYSVSATAGTGGSVTPSSQTVNSGATASFTVTADNNYNVDNVGGTCPAGSWNTSTYTTGAIASNCSVSFSFTAISTQQLQNGTPLTGLSGAQNSSAYYALDVPSGASNLIIGTSGGSGDVDLYVRFGSHPSTNSHDCAPYLNGNSETCTFSTPLVGTYYILLNGYTSYSNVTLTASYTGGETGCANSVNPVISGKTYTGKEACIATTSITTQSTVTVANNADVVFKAPLINLGQGFTAASGTSFKAGANVDITGYASSTKSIAASATAKPQVTPGGSPQPLAINKPRSLTQDELPSSLRTLLNRHAAIATDIFIDAREEHILFATETGLTFADDNGLSDIYLYDLAAGQVMLVSRGITGAAADGASSYPAMDGLAKRIVFQSDASNLTSGEDNGVADIFVFDRHTQHTERIPAVMAQPAGHPAIDAMGETILFDQYKNTTTRQIYIYDWNSHSVSRFSDMKSGDNHHPVISSDGRYVAYLMMANESHCAIHYQDREHFTFERSRCPDRLQQAGEQARPHFSTDGNEVEWRITADETPVVTRNPLH
ncbi:MAG: M12 family metallopeptidase [Chromatiales bacterium]|nr:M12 family metallopeptidase [Chromatiales bacterium]